MSPLLSALSSLTSSDAPVARRAEASVVRMGLKAPTLAPVATPTGLVAGQSTPVAGRPASLDGGPGGVMGRKHPLLGRPVSFPGKKASGVGQKSPFPQQKSPLARRMSALVGPKRALPEAKNALERRKTPLPGPWGNPAQAKHHRMKQERLMGRATRDVLRTMRAFSPSPASPAKPERFPA